MANLFHDKNRIANNIWYIYRGHFGFNVQILRPL